MVGGLVVCLINCLTDRLTNSWSCVLFPPFIDKTKARKQNRHVQERAWGMSGENQAKASRRKKSNAGSSTVCCFTARVKRNKIGSWLEMEQAKQWKQQRKNKERKQKIKQQQRARRGRAKKQLQASSDKSKQSRRSSSSSRRRSSV